ncbi:MAG: pentapeptide repeat-containing protein, partial [Escherichia coli]|nr:pentapeptide repeat-containing protein [Escherichia coli]
MIRIDFVTDDALYLDTDSLIGWDFSGMNLHRAIFDGMCLDGARFNHAHLRNISFINASLIGADLSSSALMCAWLNSADLTNCNFAQSRPIDADFRHA